MRTRRSKEVALHIETNAAGNRPVRAIVSRSTVIGLFQGDPSVVPFVSSERGVCFGKARESFHGPGRRRRVLSIDEFVAFLGDRQTIDEFETKCLDRLFRYILLGTEEDGVINRQYTRAVYRLACVMIILGPSGSSPQEFHIVVDECDRDAVWNVLIPLRVMDEAKMAASIFSPGGGRSARIGEATMWDGGWNHQGLGNSTGHDRLFLHLLAPSWMLVPDVDSQTWYFEDARLQRHLADDVASAKDIRQKMTVWDYPATRN